jgi:hypothetical protein
MGILRELHSCRIVALVNTEPGEQRHGDNQLGSGRYDFFLHDVSPVCAGALAVATPDSRMFWRVSARNFCAISGACSEENFKTMWSAAWQVAKIAVDGLVIAE